MDIKKVTEHLLDAEIEFKRLDCHFPKWDCRVWALQIDPNKKNIFVFCHVNREDINVLGYDILTEKGVISDVSDDDILDTIFKMVV